VRDAVELAQMEQRGLADRLGRHLAEAVAAEARLDGRDDAFDRLERDRPLDARALEAAQQLRALERLAARVPLHDPQGRLLEALERGEAPVALEALAATADGLARVALPRLQHARLAITTGRANHVPHPRSSVVSPQHTPDRVAGASDGVGYRSTTRFAG